MDKHSIFVLHMRSGELQERTVMVGTPMAEEMDILGEVPDVFAIPTEGFFKYSFTDNEGKHHYEPCYGYALAYRN